MTKRRTKQAAPDHSAQGQLYGFSIQITRALANLLKSRKGQAVSVEVIDDVGVEGEDGTTAEQVKSGFVNNPISDRAIGLWKTLHIWVEAIRGGALTTDTRFILYVAQPWEGKLVRLLHAAKSRKESEALLGRIRNEFWGAAPRFAKRKDLPDSLAVHVNGVLEASDDVLIGLIQAFTFEQGSSRPNDDLLPLLSQKAISESALEPVLQHLLGWLKRKIDKAIESRVAPIIAWEEFHDQVVAAAKNLDRANTVLQSTPAEISPVEIDQHLRDRTYVRQLELLESAEADLVRAVNDFLRAAADRTTWGERGDVLQRSFEEFQDKLERTWASYRKLVDLEHSGHSDVQRGQALLERCKLFQVRLQGMDVPSHFVPGSYHALADVLSVGWHPMFDKLLSSRQGELGASDTRDGASGAEGEDGAEGDDT